MKEEKTSVLVIGTGTIGEPLIGLLSDIKEKVGIGKILFHKYTPRIEDRPKIHGLIKRGAMLCVDEKKIKEFGELGFKPELTKVEAIARADVVIDCTPKGFGHQNKKDYYSKFEHNTQGFIAQGSETGFGKPFVFGVSDEILIPGEDRYLQVLSCNSHNLAVLIHALSFSEPKIPLEEGRFVCIRRANDISQITKFVPSPTVTFPNDDRFGTHHAFDAHRLFMQKGYDLNLFSSALKLNTQYMHSIWFDLKFRAGFDKPWLMEKLIANPRIALTYKDNANQIFSFGRDHGYYGRILNNTVVVVPSLCIRNGRELIGFCFTPQDGNSLLSSVAATLWFLYPEDYQERMKALNPYLYQEV